MEENFINNKKKVVIIILLVIAIVLIIGISIVRGNKDKNNKENGDKNVLGGNSQEENYNYENDFDWDGNTIASISTFFPSENRKELVIPERCDGFLGGAFTLFTENIEIVKFQGEKDIEISMLFAGWENLKEIVLPDGLTQIPNMAFFASKSLEKIEIPSNVNEIGRAAFQDNESLKSVVFNGNKITTIGELAFDECTSLKNIVLPDSIEEIGAKAFCECTNLTELTLPTNIKKIGGSAFRDSGLTDLYIPKEVELESVGYDAFYQKDRISKGEKTLTIHVVEGAWADEHFDEIFDGKCIKKYH